MSKLPPSSAKVVWVLSTPHDEIRCLAWQEGTLWTVCVYFGREPLREEVLASLGDVEFWSHSVRRHLMSLGFGEGGRLGGRQPPPFDQHRIVLPPRDLTETDEDL